MDLVFMKCNRVEFIPLLLKLIEYTLSISIILTALWPLILSGWEYFQQSTLLQ